MRIAVGVAVAFVAFGIAGGVWTLRAGGAAAPSPAPKAAEVKPADAPAMKPAPLAAASQKDDVTGSITPPPAPAPKQAMARPCANPNALGISRTVEVDTTGGPGFGFQHFKQLDFLADHEVVLTFDDGPWQGHTQAVLKALADECTTGVFFAIGKHATYYPDVLKQVAAAGHTVGTHTWSHANLNKKGMTEQQQKDEIEKGVSAVAWALGALPAPFFRFPELQHPPGMVTYLGERNVAIFSCDLDSFDFKAQKPEQVVETVMGKLAKQGKGLILMHDFQKHTGEALPTLLARLKAEGFKVVAMKAKAPMQTLPQYDEAFLKDTKLPTVSARPVSSVVQTISTN
jgi:peptidoglycan/xylan/chitin deacetylase (PgdA/CDA1 family)